MMRFGIFITTLLFITMSSCVSSKATEFKESLAQSERKAFDIILGKEGWGEKKLKYLIDDNYKGALAAVDQQGAEFDKLIAAIKKLSSEGIDEAKPLKQASIAYYEALKDLHQFDRKEIMQQELLATLKGDERNEVIDNLLALAKQKKLLYAAVYKKEALVYTATEKFNAANGF